jgi:hypothetical protein
MRLRNGKLTGSDGLKKMDLNLLIYIKKLIQKYLDIETNGVDNRIRICREIYYFIDYFDLKSYIDWVKLIQISKNRAKFLICDVLNKLHDIQDIQNAFGLIKDLKNFIKN